MKKTLVLSLPLAALLTLSFSAGFAAHAAKADKKEQKVRRLIQLTGTEAVAKQVLDSMIAEIAKNPQVPPGFAEKFRELAQKEDLVAMYVPIYLKHLAEPDLDAAITFYSSASGRRLTQAQPAIVQESMQAGQAWGQRLAEQALKELEAERAAAPGGR